MVLNRRRLIFVVVHTNDLLHLLHPVTLFLKVLLEFNYVTSVELHLAVPHISGLFLCFFTSFCSILVNLLHLLCLAPSVSMCKITSLNNTSKNYFTCRQNYYIQLYSITGYLDIMYLVQNYFLAENFQVPFLK